MKEKVSLAELFLTFAKAGVMTFGGGMAMLPLLMREIVDNKKWATEEELSDYYAIAQCTPGIIAVNTATFVGAKHRGIIGGIFATLGMVFPSLIIITLLAGVISLIADNPLVQKAFMGIRISVCVLVLNSAVKLWKTAIKGKISILIFVLSGFLVLFINLSPVVVVLITIALGILFHKYAPSKEGGKA